MKTICPKQGKWNQRAPWWGGLFERMMKSTKRCLRKIIGRMSCCAITEVEMILNSRSLSYVSTEDIEEPLMPSHLITRRRTLNSLLDCNEDWSDDELDLSHETLGRRMKHLNRTLEHFWKQWRMEYLVQLRQCHRYNRIDSSVRLHKGDIVLVHDKHHNRGFWKVVRWKN